MITSYTRVEITNILGSNPSVELPEDQKALSSTIKLNNNGCN